MSCHNGSNHTNECKPSLLIVGDSNMEESVKNMNTMKLGAHSDVMDTDNWILDVNRNCSLNNHCESLQTCKLISNT